MYNQKAIEAVLCSMFGTFTPPIQCTEEQLAEAFKTMSPRIVEILDLYYGLTSSERQSLKQIAQHYEVSEERVRQIWNKGIRLLWHPTRLGKFAPKDW